MRSDAPGKRPSRAPKPPHDQNLRFFLLLSRTPSAIMSSTSSYECAICLHRYQSPTLIPTCGHTFCASCVASLPTDRLRSTASCPLCRNRFDVRACVPNYALAAALESEAHGEPASPRPSAPPLETMQFTTHAPNVPRASQSSAVQRLRSLGFPAGLARLVTDADSRVGLRLFILDNSGSTGEMDGNKLTAEYGTLKMKACSRWDEIKAMAVLQAPSECQPSFTC